MRTVAQWDPARMRTVLLWPLREVLLAYIAILKRDALERYEHDMLIWAALTPHQKNPSSPPKPPHILGE